MSVHGPPIVDVLARRPRELRDVLRFGTGQRHVGPPALALARTCGPKEPDHVLHRARTVLPALGPAAACEPPAVRRLHELRPHPRRDVVPPHVGIRVVSRQGNGGRAFGEEIAGKVVPDRLVLGEAARVVPTNPRIERSRDRRARRVIQRRTEPVVSDGHAYAVVADGIPLVLAWGLAAGTGGRRHCGEHTSAGLGPAIGRGVVRPRGRAVAKAKGEDFRKIALAVVSCAYVRRVGISLAAREIYGSSRKRIAMSAQRSPSRVSRSGSAFQTIEHWPGEPDACSDRVGRACPRRKGCMACVASATDDHCTRCSKKGQAQTAGELHAGSSCSRAHLDGSRHVRALAEPAGRRRARTDSVQPPSVRVRCGQRSPQPYERTAP